LIKKGILIEEFTRIGGGQAVGLSIMEALKEHFQFDLVADKRHPKVKADLFGRIFETSYDYYEGINRFKLVLKIVGLRKELRRKNNLIRSYNLSINNHPNIFIFNADINVIHEFFLRESMTSEGEFKKTMLSELIRKSGIYSIYDHSNFIFSGNYGVKKSKEQFTYLGIRPRCEIVNYPVVFPDSLNLSEKKPIVLTFGRINPDKDLEKIYEIASGTNFRFVIAGAVNKGSEEYYRKLLEKKPENVEIISNPTDQEKLKLFSEAKLYLHTKRFEIYGLSVAEAIGHGCIPIVPKNGGPWEDIVCKGKYGYGYDTVEEAKSLIKNLITEKFSVVNEIYDSRFRFSFNTFRETFTEYSLKICEQL
jgi:glycosyltransferase involved in cell wall biosynthesis